MKECNCCGILCEPFELVTCEKCKETICLYCLDCVMEECLCGEINNNRHLEKEVEHEH